ncbi:MAG TPA: tripartite tricarboxylate transporter substrate-binding protein, partial [Xanthobacteraceae bacterium]|nr:tripartite tricarboxylate transporter substrate-binding protein [Xanthobacteraceae bacterium]
AAGGPTDVLGRILGQRMSQSLGQQIIVENVTGAGGTLGAARVAKAAADGYTMVMGNLGTHAASVGLYKNLAYDPRTSFEPVMLASTTPMVLLAKKDLPVRNLQDLIALAHTRQLTCGSAGVGSISHLTLLLFDKLAHTKFQHVPYRGSSQVVNDLLGGQIDITFDQAINASPHVTAGDVRAIAVTGPTRAAAIPDVPTTAEAGLAELDTTAWSALFVPKGTPPAIVARLNAAMSEAMEDKDVIARLAKLGADVPAPEARTPAALGKLVRSEIDKWVPLIASAELSVN